MMRLSKVLGVRRIKIRNRIFTLGIIISGMLSLTFGVITFYGQNAGNMIMMVDPTADNRSIRITIDPERKDLETRLMSEPIEGARDITFSWIKLDEIIETYGNYVDEDHDYVAYTFYVVNDGMETVDLRYYVRITDIYKNLDDGIRVIIVDEGVTTLYMKPDQTNDTYYPDSMPPAKHFLSSRLVMRQQINNFKPGDYRKISVVIYLEGFDPDTTDALLGGMIKMEMVFSLQELE